MCVGGPVSEQLAELQPGRQWPTFTAEAGKLGARAVFAFPLAIGVRHQAHRL